MFKVGDTVIHPGYGVCKIKTIQKDSIEKTEVYVIKPKTPLPGNFKILIAKEKIGKTGLHYPIRKNKIHHVFQILEAEPYDISDDRNRGYPLTRKKLLSGNLYRIAEMVRDLENNRNYTLYSSIGKELLNNAIKILALEIAYVKCISKDKIEECIKNALNKNRR